ncbi:hypothetical protein RRSWK_03261 [Rhodopirellula sp. SWK7]|nr:hypothetical protein RRSWK_03261 [Rhodopirellula sp. SWK7]
MVAWSLTRCSDRLLGPIVGLRWAIVDGVVQRGSFADADQC